MMSAIPLVNPVTTGYGMNLIAPPNRASPIATSRTPAMRVHATRPSKPCFWTIPATITTKAPVGPPICTRLPPRKEMRKPATAAVIRPFSGATPEAMANASASGTATMPTTTPAWRSAASCADV